MGSLPRGGAVDEGARLPSTVTPPSVRHGGRRGQTGSTGVLLLIPGLAEATAEVVVRIMAKFPGLAMPYAIPARFARRSSCTLRRERRRNAQILYCLSVAMVQAIQTRQRSHGRGGRRPLLRLAAGGACWR